MIAFQSKINVGGFLCIRHPWPGIMRTMWGDHQKFIDTYFKTFKIFIFPGMELLSTKMETIGF